MHIPTIAMTVIIDHLQGAGARVQAVPPRDIDDFAEDWFEISNQAYSVRMTRTEILRAAKLGPDALLRGVHDRLLEVERQATAAMHERVDERMPLQWDPIYREIL